jgi:hypothetical protein
MKVPPPGTYPSMCIREGSHGTSDPAAKNWDKTFGVRKCGFCANFRGNGQACIRRDKTRYADDACILQFERLDLPTCAGVDMMPTEEPKE